MLFGDSNNQSVIKLRNRKDAFIVGCYFFITSTAAQGYLNLSWTFLLKDKHKSWKLCNPSTVYCSLKMISQVTVLKSGE